MLTSIVEVYHCLLFAIILGIMHWFPLVFKNRSRALYLYCPNLHVMDADLMMCNGYRNIYMYSYTYTMHIFRFASNRTLYQLASL